MSFFHMDTKMRPTKTVSRILCSRFYLLKYRFSRPSKALP